MKKITLSLIVLFSYSSYGFTDKQINNIVNQYLGNTAVHVQQDFCNVTNSENKKLDTLLNSGWSFHAKLKKTSEKHQYFSEKKCYFILTSDIAIHKSKVYGDKGIKRFNNALNHQFGKNLIPKHNFKDSDESIMDYQDN